MNDTFLLTSTESNPILMGFCLVFVAMIVFTIVLCLSPGYVKNRRELVVPALITAPSSH